MAQFRVSAPFKLKTRLRPPCASCTKIRCESWEKEEFSLHIDAGMSDCDEAAGADGGLTQTSGQSCFISHNRHDGHVTL